MSKTTLYNIVLKKGSEKSFLNRNVVGRLAANRKKINWMQYHSDKGCVVEIERAEVRQ